jgi:hypothetical protein
MGDIDGGDAAVFGNFKSSPHVEDSINGIVAVA